MNSSHEVAQLWNFSGWPLTYIALPIASAIILAYFLNVSAPEITATVAVADLESDDENSFASMGAIEPLSSLDWRTEDPRKIYKFSPKYFLTMGLTNTNINFITQMDKQFAERLVERQKILDTHPNALKCLPSAVPMVNELYTYLITYHLPQRYPTIFIIQQNNQVLNTVMSKVLPARPPKDPIEALRILAVNIDEDFLMLLPAPDGDGYSLQSFVWCYPVGFDAGDKLGLKLKEAHKPVPEYKEKLQRSMEKYFSRLQIGRVVYRVNWAIATNASLCEDGEYHLYEGQESSEEEIDIANCWVRCELQTLFALPKSGGRILSVHLYLYPLQQIKDEGLGEELCEAIDGLKLGNAPAFWRYKRAPIWQQKVKKFLRSERSSSIKRN